MMHCLIIFAKEPEKGRVKTRLNKYLSEGKCMDLYKAFLKDTVDLAKKIKSKIKILAYDASRENPGYLKSVARAFVFYRQDGRDLGERMHNAFKFAKASGASKTVIIGSDSPNLPLRFLRRAFLNLNKNDLVLGPSIDGGYYLIGLKKPRYKLFKDIKWGSGRVFEQTIKKAKKLKLETSVLDKWYDVDNKKTLALLADDLKRKHNQGIAKCTRSFLRWNTIMI